MTTQRRVALAFSGGLDTSYCLVTLREQGYEVFTVTVNTGGLLATQMDEIRERAESLGAAKHIVIDGRARLYDEFVSYLIKANYLRNGAYPSCVGVERMLQAEEVTKVALAEGADAIAHGSTGAGNDHVRFDAVIRTLAPQMELLAPIREGRHTREEERDELRARGIEVADITAKYSFNHGLMGATIGGEETYGSWEYLPEEAWPSTASVNDAPEEGQELTIRFERGLPVGYTLDGQAPGTETGHHLFTALGDLGAKHGVGRGIHTGQTIMGIIGRLGFEAPGMFVLLAAHRELERLVLNNRRQSLKAYLGGLYGDMLHEALYYDPLMRDIEAFLDSSQERVSGDVRVRLHKGNIVVLGCRSPHSLLDAGRRLGSKYGHGSSMWTGEEARAFARLYALPGILATAAQAPAQTSAQTPGKPNA